MGHKDIMVEKSVVCCDLCGEPIDERNKQSTLNVTYLGHNTLHATILHLVHPYQNKSFDFHTDCLVKLVEANMGCYEDNN